MTDRELFEKLIATMEKVDKAGTLAKFFQNTEEKNVLYSEDLPFISEEEGYKEIRDNMYFRVVMCVQRAEEEMGKAKFFISRTTSLYKTYKPNEKDITNPVILKFIKDYEEDNGLKGDGE